jgi:hypothetical protein
MVDYDMLKVQCFYEVRYLLLDFWSGGVFHNSLKSIAVFTANFCNKSGTITGEEAARRSAKK